MQDTSDDASARDDTVPAEGEGGTPSGPSKREASSTTTVEVSTPTGTRRPPIVGIGASAGGLESLEKLFRALPARTGAAFLVVQHLSPHCKSLMEELLAHPGTDQGTRQRAIDVLNRQASQIWRLLGDLLDASLITHIRFELARAPLDLREPVRIAIDAAG